MWVEPLFALTLELTTPAGRRLPMSEVLEALVVVGRAHRGELLAVLEETPREG